MSTAISFSDSDSSTAKITLLLEDIASDNVVYKLYNAFPVASDVPSGIVKVSVVFSNLVDEILPLAIWPPLIAVYSLFMRLVSF